jgi:nucleotide-binding universal stress UspA family protein
LPNAVYRSTYYGTTFVPPTKELEEYAQSDAEMYLARIAARLEITGVRTKWLRGRATPDAIITEYLHAQPPGIAVMASHGRGGIARWVLGSTTEGVVSGAPCPVLVVRATTASHDEKMATEVIGAGGVGIRIDRMTHSTREVHEGSFPHIRPGRG